MNAIDSFSHIYKFLQQMASSSILLLLCTLSFHTVNLLYLFYCVSCNRVPDRPSLFRVIYIVLSDSINES